MTYKGAVGLEHVVSIVGIDEVDLDRGYISWRSPLANALMKASPGDRVDLCAPAKTERLEIINVEYAPIPMDPFREPLGAESTPKVEGSRAIISIQGTGRFKNCRHARTGRGWKKDHKAVRGLPQKPTQPHFLHTKLYTQSPIFARRDPNHREFAPDLGPPRF